MQHTFAVCAYKDSLYLPEAMESLKKQRVASEMFIATSTPSGYIKEIAAQYNVPVLVNGGEGGIGGDWNFAYNAAKTCFVTLAHQDDVYEADFTGNVLSKINKKKNVIIAFTDYFEIRGQRRTYKNVLLATKRLMLAPVALFSGSAFIRRGVLSFGNPICCPSITYNKGRFSDFQFSREYKCSLDWEALCRLSKEKGDFMYIAKPLVGHRISERTETAKSIATGVRREEDLRILSGLWGPAAARLIMAFYSKAMNNNKIKKPIIC